VAARLDPASPGLHTPVLLGQILIASGVLPGHRGVWRSMHLGGHLEAQVARRIWPAWLERAEIEMQEHSDTDDKQDA
jgi:hypothetical protein